MKHREIILVGFIVLVALFMARCYSEPAASFVWGGTSACTGSEVAWWYGKGVGQATGDWKDVGSATRFDIAKNWPGLLAQTSVTIGVRPYNDVSMERVADGVTMPYTEHKPAPWTLVYWTPKAWATIPAPWSDLRLEVTR